MNDQAPFIAQFIETYPLTIAHSSTGTKTANKEGPDEPMDIIGCIKTVTATKQSPDQSFACISNNTKTRTFSKEQPDADFSMKTMTRTKESPDHI